MNAPALPRLDTYADCLAFLYARNQFAIKLGLDNIKALLDHLGRPDKGLRILHVAGTNGKGSVCANLAALLGATGRKRVGLYTSPHLVSFRERIRVDGRPVEREWVTAWMRKHVPRILELGSTYFECVTAMALAYFRDRGCEAVVLETGLGGRLDATNAVRPVLSVITSISLDHTSILGDTVEAIWREKIAILKPGVPMVVREERPRLLAELEENARSAGSPVYSLRDFPWRRTGTASGPIRFQGRFAAYDLPADLRAEDHQVENLCLALLAMETHLEGPVSLPASLPALRGAAVPGRTQLLTAPGRIPVLLDGAHNPGGMDALSAAIHSRFPGQKITALFGVMRDKDWLGVYRAVRGFAAEARFVDLGPWFPRALPYAELAAALPPDEPLPAFPLEAAALDGLTAAPAAGSAPARATLESAPAAVPDLIVICGSLYLLGKAIPFLLPHYPGLAPFRDFLDET